MKRIILTLGILFSVLTIKAQSTKIDFDYTKQFDISSLWIDFNQNEEPEIDEFFMSKNSIKCSFAINHKDFGSAGNRMYITLSIDNPKGNSKTFKGSLEDVRFIKTAKGYGVSNKLGEKLIFVGFEDNEYTLMILNPMILR